MKIRLITNFIQVKASGYLSRKLSLLCMNTLLDVNQEDCGSTEYINVFVDEKTYQRLNGRYYLNEEKNELELINIETDESKKIINTTIKLRSPITCQGHNKMICKKCYGELSQLNDDIHVGKFGVDVFGSQVTQKLLSSKHTLKTNSEQVKWHDVLLKYFKFDGNIISLGNELDNKYAITFNLDDLDEYLNNNQNESEDQEEFNPVSINSFTFTIDDKSELIELEKELFLSDYLINVLQKNSERNEEENTITIKLKDIDPEESLFFFVINNSEISKYLDDVITLIDKKDHLGVTNKHELINKFTELLTKSGITIDLVHIENIVREMLRSKTNNTERNFIEGEYDILRVSDSIINSSSIINSLSFEHIKKQLLNPNTYKKSDSSYLDILFK